MTDKIVCPYQQTEGFSFDVCRSCGRFQNSRGKKVMVGCRGNQTAEHKRGFEAAFLLDYLGKPYKVEVTGKEE